MEDEIIKSVPIRLIRSIRVLKYKMNMKQVKRLLPVLLALVGLVAVAQPADWSFAEDKLNFYVANDLGRNGYYDQKPIAELMGTLAETIGTPEKFEFITGLDAPVFKSHLWKVTFRRQAVLNQEQEFRQETLFRVVTGELDGKPYIVSFGFL